MTANHLEKCELVAAEAHRMYRHGEDWMTLFRAILGSSGLARRQFQDAESFKAWEVSAAKLAVDLLIHIRKLESNPKRRQNLDRTTEKPARILLRTTQELHDRLRAEGIAKGISLNRLCHDKLSAMASTPDKVVEPVHSRFARTLNYR
jgi:predicted HicB family RNase H-like nuclease